VRVIKIGSFEVALDIDMSSSTITYQPGTCSWLGMTPSQVAMTPYDSNSPMWHDAFKAKTAAFSPLTVDDANNCQQIFVYRHSQSTSCHRSKFPPSPYLLPLEPPPTAAANGSRTHRWKATEFLPLPLKLNGLLQNWSEQRLSYDRAC